MAFDKTGLQPIGGQAKAGNAPQWWSYTAPGTDALADINTFLGFNVVTLGDRDEGGLPIDGSSDRTCYAFHRDALGLGIGMGQTSRVDYIAEKTSYLVASMFSAGAVAIDDEGIVTITCRES